MFCVPVIAQKAVKLLEVAAETAALLAEINPAHQPRLAALSAQYFQLLAVCAYVVLLCVSAVQCAPSPPLQEISEEMAVAMEAARLVDAPVE